MVAEIIDPLKYPDWNGLLMTNPDASFFHTANWARVLFESYGYVPKYLSVLQNGALTALLPFMLVDSPLTGRRGVSLPFSDFSDSFAKDKSLYRDLADYAIQFGIKSGWKNIEIRGGTCPWRETESFSEYYGHRLVLGHEEKQIFERFRDNNKRNIKKSIKSVVSVTFSKSLDAIDAFYRMNLRTRKEHGVPPQPKRFFRKIQEHALEKNLGTVVLASHEGRYIAGAVFFHFGTTAIYKYGASYDSGKRIRANNLVMWEAIRFFKRAGFKNFLLGRTDFDNKGLRDYKLGYGTDEYIIPYFKYDLRRNRPVRKNIKAVSEISKAYRYIPIPLSRLVGTFLYKHIG